MRTQFVVALTMTLCASLVTFGPAVGAEDTGLDRTSEPRPAAACAKVPGEILDLGKWKLQLPTGAAEKPDEIKQPKLAKYLSDPWFVPTEKCDGVRFRAAVDGVTTKGSKYPRSELREVSENGDKAEWSTSKGTHTMVINEAVTHLPADKQHVVAGQIHGGDDDLTVFRLEGTKLYVTNGDEAHHKLVISDYKLGTPFEAKFVAGGGEVKAYFNGELQTTIKTDSSTAYFKSGAYTQANCDNSKPCEKSNYGEVVVNKLTVTHT